MRARMALTVVIRSGELKMPATITFDAPRIVIGRGEGCEVRLPDPSVSHRHASVRQRGTDYVIVDEGSTNGTFVGPVRLSPQAPRVVRSGDLVRVGRIWLELRVEQALATQNPQVTTREIALSLISGALSSQGEQAQARVWVQSGPDAGKELVLSDFERVYVIGRAPNADLPITDADASRRQVEIFRRGASVCVRDLGSKNGTELDGARLVADRETPWSEGSVLRIGATELGLRDPVALALSEIEAAADERMRSGDAIEPPTALPGSVAPGEHGANEDAKPPPEPRAGAPIAAVPRAAEPVRPGERSSGLRSVDLLIALLAIAVLGLSVLGIFWLLR